MDTPQTTAFGVKVLAAGVVAAWLLTSEEIARFKPETITLILVVFVLVLFIFLSKSLYDRLAWALAFPAFGLQQVPVGGIYISVPDVMLVFLALEAPFTLQLRNQKFSPMGVLAIGLLIATCISVISSPVMVSILGLSARYAILLLLFIALDRVGFTKEALARTRSAMALAFPVALILFYFSGDLLGIVLSVDEGSRPPHSQILPFLCTLVFPWYLLRYRRVVAALLLGSVYAVVTWVGQSRGMIVAAFATLLIVVFVKLKRTVWPLLISVTLMGLLGTYYVGGIEEVVADMASRPESDEMRLYKMRLSMESFREHPVFGTGPGSESAITQRRHGEAIASENGLVQSLAESGLLGATLFLAIVLYAIWQLYYLAKRRVIGRDLVGVLMIMVVAAVAPLSYASGMQGWSVWLLLAVVNKHIGWAQSGMSIEASSVAAPGDSVVTGPGRIDSLVGGYPQHPTEA